MNRIASFCVDHDKLEVGMYVSRVDGDVITYDVRMCKPNGGVYLEPKEMHTIEHLMATYLRNTEYSDQIVYVGPMGCRTGFYILTRDSLPHEKAIGLVRDAFAFTRDFEGIIPGSERKECGNYQEHDLPKAKRTAGQMVTVLDGWDEEKLQY